MKKATGEKLILGGATYRVEKSTRKVAGLNREGYSVYRSSPSGRRLVGFVWQTPSIHWIASSRPEWKFRFDTRLRAIIEEVQNG